jgi:diguanylate cyclase (GGDEF)-like protein
VAGDVEGHEAALRAAEASAMETQHLQEARVGDVVAMAHPMRVEAAGRVVGVLAVAREGASYAEADRDLLQYLAGQAAVSIENVSLHETVQRQAVTDELTGLFNHRHLQEVLAAEVERTRRFDQQLGLIMLDIDDFKRVNDSHGHLQGDLVLREVARVLRETAREIDIPARYGGEEMAVVLPQTDMQGAFRFAERVRRRIERLDLPLLDRSGTLHITASLGVAAIPGSAAPTKDALVGAADAALYRAKREGKNRTERADAVPSER